MLLEQKKLQNDRMETTCTKAMSIWRRNNIEKSTWRTHQCFVDFESLIHVEISMSKRCHNFHLDSPFKSDIISTNFPRGISMSNRLRIDENVYIGMFKDIYAKHLCGKTRLGRHIFTEIIRGLTRLFDKIRKNGEYWNTPSLK